MKNLRTIFAAALFLAGSFIVASAQTNPGITAQGVITPGNCMEWVTKFKAQDAGTPCGGTPPVLSVFGRTGAVVAASGDYNFNQLSGTVTTAQIANLAITTALIANSNVTYAKMQNVAASRLLGNPTGSAAAPSEISLGSGLYFSGTTLNATGGNSVMSYGAVGDCVTDDTAAFQAAINAAAGSSGVGTIFVPATTTCYLVGALNGTNKSNWIMEGVGDQSVIKINAADSQANWFDLSGSSNIQFRNLKFIDNGTAYGTLFLWACTGTTCGTSGILMGLSFDHVNINAKSSNAFLYAYGYGCVAGAACPGGGSLSLSNGTWTQTNMAGSAADYRTGVQNAILVFDAQNSRNKRSAYVTLTTSAATAWRTVLTNMQIIDYSNGATRSNNSAAVFSNVNQFVMTGGNFQCNCYVATGIMSNSEGLTFTQVGWQPPDSTVDETYYWIFFGNGHIDFVTLVNPFFSSPGAGYIGVGQPLSSTDGGVGYLRVMGNDVGLNNSAVPFIRDDLIGCGATWPVASYWFYGMNLDFTSGAQNITTCGSIDGTSFLQNPGTITIPAGATNAAATVPGQVAWASAVAATPLTGSTTETTLRTIIIPPMGPNDRLEIETLWSYSGGTGTWAARVKLDGTAFTAFPANATTSLSQLMVTRISNRNSVSSQVGASLTQANWSVNTTAPVTAAINTAVAKNLTITGQLANGADTMNLESYSIKLIRPNQQ